MARAVKDTFHSSRLRHRRHDQREEITGHIENEVNKSYVPSTILHKRRSNKLQNLSRAQCFVALEVTCESWDGRHYDDDMIGLSFTCSADNALNDGSTNLILDWTL